MAQVQIFVALQKLQVIHQRMNYSHTRILASLTEVVCDPSEIENMLMEIDVFQVLEQGPVWN